MERHLRSRRARGRLIAAALAGAGLGWACVPLAPFERPEAPPDGAPVQASDADAAGEARAPDLPEPGDEVAVPSETAAPEAETVAAPEPATTPAPAPAAEPVAEPASATAQVAPAQEPPVAPEGDPVLAEVRGVLEAFYAAYNAREWKLARTYFWDGATITEVRIRDDQPTPGVSVSSVAEFFDELSQEGAAGPLGFRGSLEGAPAVRIASNVAQAWCPFRASFGGPQQSMSWRRVDAFTFVLHEGSWKISSLAQSSSSEVPDSR